jgi:hypothetical protein
MARTRISREQYDALIRSFREGPGNIIQAAEAASVRRATAKRAWEHGWEYPTWAVSIRELLEEEDRRRKARAKIVAVEEVARQEVAEAGKVRRQAEYNAVEQKAREGQAITQNLLTIMAGFAAMSKMAATGVKVAEHVAKELDAKIRSGSLSIAEGIRFLGQFSRLAKDGTFALMENMKANRLALGEPDQNIGHHHTGFVGERTVADVFGDNRAAFRKALADASVDQFTSPEVRKFMAAIVDRETIN